VLRIKTKHNNYLLEKVMKKNRINDEINLFEIFQTIIHNKIKIILIVVLTIAVAFSFKIIDENSAKQSKFTTKIRAISIIEEARNYDDLNLNVDSENIELNRFTLFELFVKIFNSDKKKIVKNFNFIKRENYENEKAYEIALDKIVSSIKIVKFEGIDNEKIATEGIIEFKSQNENVSNKWGEFLNTLEYTVNKITQKYLKEIIINKIENDKIVQQNKVEDIESEIKRNLRSYEFEIKSRLLLLEEQAKIAREGNIIYLRSFEESNNYLINKKNNPLSYYVKDYRVIEKEIELIKERKDSYFFAKGMPILKARKLKIQNDKSIIRMEAKFKKTPIFSNNDFLGGVIETTSIELIGKFSNVSTIKIIILASLIGLIIGVFYVAISNAISNTIIHSRK
jgi:LPS O-antigen subunit length determinant protein (WzzB/FepE family)